MTQKPRMEMSAWLAAAALSLSVAGCSSASSTGSGLPPTGAGNGNESGSNQSSSSGGGSASGGSNGSGTGASTSTGGSGAAASGASSSGAVTGSGSGSSSGSGASSGASSGGTTPAGDDGGSAAMPSRGCGQGTSCTVSDDLAPPDPADGFQFVLKAGMVTIQPNQEAYYCYYKTIPGNAAIEIGAFQSWMSKGASHHFITYAGTSGADGTVSQCAGGGGKWVYATSVSGETIELKMPDTVGLSMAAGTQLMMNMHFINPGTTPATPTLKLNVLYAKNVQYQAGTMISFNTGINIPPGTATAPGTQTVRGTCTAPVGSKFFAITTHTHKHATVTDVNYVTGGMTTNIVHTTDWEAPDVGLWYAPNFLTFNQGDSFTYSCSYSNSSSSYVTVGETAASNEMCMAIGYYFPAGSALCQ